MRKQALARKKVFQKTFKKYGVSPKALQWKNSKSAEIRYRNLVADINFEDKSVVDIGCGFGDVIAYIEKKTNNFYYLGIDVVPEFIKEAKKRHPKYSFKVGDWQKLIKSHDIVISSGVLNNKVNDNEYSYREKAVSLMYKNTKKVLAFNMAGGFPQPKNKAKYKVYYVNSLRILKYTLGLTRKVILRHQYREKGFTIIMFRDNKKSTN